MTEKVEITKRPPDLYGIGFCAREVNRDVGTTRGYVHRLYAAGAAGVLRVSNGLFVLAPRGLEALRRAVRESGRATTP